MIVVYLCVAFLSGSRGTHADACLPLVVASVLSIYGSLLPMLMDLVACTMWRPYGPCGLVGSIHIISVIFGLLIEFLCCAACLSSSCRKKKCLSSSHQMAQVRGPDVSYISGMH
jgi:hypothetical protein